MPWLTSPRHLDLGQESIHRAYPGAPLPMSSVQDPQPKTRYTQMGDRSWAGGWRPQLDSGIRRSFEGRRAWEDSPAPPPPRPAPACRPQAWSAAVLIVPVLAIMNSTDSTFLPKPVAPNLPRGHRGGTWRPEASRGLTQLPTSADIRTPSSCPSSAPTPRDLPPASLFFQTTSLTPPAPC